MVTSTTLRSEQLVIYSGLCTIIPPKDQSDRTTYRRICTWLVRKCEAGVFNIHEAAPRVLDFAREAANPCSRNPAAVFVSILKKEMGYPK